MSSLPGMSIDATVVRTARSASDQLGHVRYFAIAVLGALLLLIATSCSAPETRLVRVPVEKEVVKEVEVEKVVEVVKEVPVEKVVEVVKEVPVEKEVVKEVEVPVEVVVEKEVIKEVEVEKVVTKEVIKEVPVEKVVTKEVIKEVPVEKVVTKEVIREVVVIGDASTAPPGRQLAQHTHEGEIYTLVEYDHQIAVFSASGSPVSNSRLADDVLLSYAWGQTLAGLDVAGIAASVAAVEGMDDNLDGVRASSNETVRVLAQLDALSAQVPLVGRVSAMDVIAEVYPGVAAAASAIRSLDAELDSLGRNADALAAFVRRMERADPSDVSGGDMDAAFGSAVKAARDMEESVGSARGKVATVRDMSGEMANALRQVSDTPVIGETLAESAETAASFESELSGIADTLQSYESGLANLAGQLQAPLDATVSAHQSYVGRWLQRPYDTAWQDGVGSQPAPAAVSDDDQPATVSRHDILSVGWYHACGVDPDGTLTCWGEYHGSASPTSAPPEKFVAVGAGGGHTCGVKTDGAVECWGYNEYGQASPPRGEFVTVSAGDYHTCGIRSDGTIECWGDNEYGQVSPPAGKFVTVSAKWHYTCGVTTADFVACWGYNKDGQASPPAGKFVTVSAGGAHTCGVKTDGVVECWGYNEDDQASPPAGEFVAVGAGNKHTCGVKTDGYVVCWGDKFGNDPSPPAGAGKFVTVSAGGDGYTCGVKTDGSFECWGGDN